MLMLLTNLPMSGISEENNLCNKCFKQGRVVSKDLRECSSIVKQERDRWVNIHSNPVKDKVTVTEKEKSLEIDISIDTGISNDVNSYPIMRKYELTRTPWFEKPIPDMDLYMAASMSLNAGWRPAIGIGFQPEILERFTNGYRVGVGLYTTFLTGGLDIYVLMKNTKFLSFHLLIGADWDGKPSPGIGLGVSF